MKKTVLPMLACLLLLCGCGGRKALNVQEQYRSVTSAELEAEVVSCADAAGRVFTLTCRYDPAGQSVTTVTAPQELAGLTAVLVGEELSVRSGDTLLPAGASTDVCPANCLPYLLRTLAGGYLTEQNEESLGDTPCLRLTLDAAGRSGTPVSCAVWLDRATLIPRYGEFSQNGQVVLTVKMLSFTCQTEE